MRKWWMIPFAVWLTTLSCATIQVNQDYDPATDLSGLKTFAWTSPTQPASGDPRIDNPLRDDRIRSAVERVLAQKGFTLSTAGTPTFMVRYQYLLYNRIDTGGGGIQFGIGSFGSHGGIAIGTGTGGRAGTVDEASLVIDIVAPTSDDLLWRGTGTERFKTYDDPVKATAAIHTLVEKILAQFPPEPPPTQPSAEAS